MKRLRNMEVSLIFSTLLAIPFGTAMQAQVAPKAKERHPLEFYDRIHAKLAARRLNLNQRLAAGAMVSMVQLLANPGRYHNKPVQLMAFLRVEFEGCGIYLSRDDANYLINSNSLWVSFGGDWKGQGLEPAQFNRKFVLIEGIYDKDEHGHLGMSPGAIYDAWRVMELEKVYND